MTSTLVAVSLEHLAGTKTSCGFGDFARSASLRNSLRRQKEPYWIQQLRFQLQEQLRCLESRTEDHNAMLAEVQDFYRRRAEVEADYSKSMDKLVKHVVSKHKADKRESWPGYSTYSIWQTLLSTTRKLAKDHATLADLYAVQMTSRTSELAEDSQRIFKKCKEMATSHHAELLKSLSELQSSLKTYQLYYNESQHAEGKLRQVEGQRVKVENGFGGRVVLSRRIRSLEKQVAKRQLKCMESGLRAVKARNEYLLCLEAANASVQKYFNDDQHDLITNMDYGYHTSLFSAMSLHSEAEEGLLHSRTGCLDLLKKRLKDLDQKLDKQNFLDLHPLPFQAPAPFEFQAYKGDEVSQLLGHKSVQDELIERLRSIAERLNTLKVENDEIWKTLETTDTRLVDMVSSDTLDVITLFQDDSSTSPPRSPLERDKFRSDKIETEDFYLNKFNDFHSTNNLITRLQAKYSCIEKALADQNSLALANIKLPDRGARAWKKRVVGRDPLVAHPILFGGTITDYVQAVGEDIPLVIRSCVKMINLYGMHHQGVFRVSGSQIEINEFKNQFELGKDPLPDKVDGKDINSVAGVLKLYFRELREPLFPAHLFPKLINFISNHSFNNHDDLPETISLLRNIFSSNLPKAVLIVANYLFAFLNHLAEFSDENMMDPYNLAICFAPTLMPIPPHEDQVLYQNHVTEIIKNLIIFPDEVLPSFPGSTVYQRCEIRVDGPPMASNTFSDDEEILDEINSEDDLDSTEAVALFDFHGRTERELTFKKGDKLVVFEKVSPDWWEGVVEGKEGLLPDKYISVRTRNRYGDFETGDEDRFKSTESLPLKSYQLSVVDSEDLSPMSASHPNLELRHQVFNHPSSLHNHTNQHIHHSHHHINQSHHHSNHNHSHHHNDHSSSNSSSSSQATSVNNDELTNIRILTAYKVQGDRQTNGLKAQQRESDCQADTHKGRKSNGQKINRSVSCGAHSKSSSDLKPHVIKQDTHANVEEININNNNNCGHNKYNNVSNKEKGARKGSHSAVRDLSSEIDTALAEVMSSIHSLGLQASLSSLEDLKHDTPDLVIDLPLSSSSATTPKQVLKSSVASSSSSSSSSSASPNSSHITNAEVFANVDQSTIKKGKSFEKQASFIAPSTNPKLITTTITSPMNLIHRQQNLPAKKYATLGRTDGKARQRDALECVDVEKNSFGKPRQVPPPVVKQFSTPDTSPNPPARTSSRFINPELPHSTPKNESTPLSSSFLARAPKLDPTINQPTSTLAFTLVTSHSTHNPNINSVNNFFNKQPSQTTLNNNFQKPTSPRVSHTLPPNSQLLPNDNISINTTPGTTSTTNNNNIKSSYGKSKISMCEIPKLKIIPDKRVSESNSVFASDQQRHSLPAFSPTNSSKPVQSPTKPATPHHPHHPHHLPLSFRLPAPPLPETENPSYNPILTKPFPKAKPPLMKKPPKSLDFMRRMTVDSVSYNTASLASYNSIINNSNNSNNRSSNTCNDSSSARNAASLESVDNPLHISKDL